MGVDNYGMPPTTAIEKIEAAIAGLLVLKSRIGEHGTIGAFADGIRIVPGEPLKPYEVQLLESWGWITEASGDEDGRLEWVLET